MTRGRVALSFGESAAKNFIMGMKLAQLVPRRAVSKTEQKELSCRSVFCCFPELLICERNNAILKINLCMVESSEKPLEETRCRQKRAFQKIPKPPLSLLMLFNTFFERFSD